MQHHRSIYMYFFMWEIALSTLGIIKNSNDKITVILILYNEASCEIYKNCTDSNFATTVILEIFTVVNNWRLKQTAKIEHSKG